MHRVALVHFVLVLLAACSPQEIRQEECSNNVDCPSSQSCLQGSCSEGEARLACRVESEIEDCGIDSYCADQRCEPLPSCDVGCPLGFGCDASTNVCTRTLQEDCSDCDNGIFCDGPERCDPATGTCISGTPPCTIDECNEAAQSCGCLSDDDCNASETCNGSGLCECLASCAGKICGDDGCGGTCGECTAPQECNALGQCESGGILFIGAGDIAACGEEDDLINGSEPHELTAQMIEAYPADTPVFALGDTAYSVGSSEEYAQCYDPSWGRFKDRTYPVVGNHEYKTDNAQGYYDYFGVSAGDPDKGYYSFELGNWHVVVLNSECTDGFIDGVCDPFSGQVQWLERDLAASTAECTLAMWHRPRFSSGHHGDGFQMHYPFEVLVDNQVDLAITGHEHGYERFAPMDEDGDIDVENGLRQIIAGTGGVPLRNNPGARWGSEFFDDQHHGILELRLMESSFTWKFITTDGVIADLGADACH